MKPRVLFVGRTRYRLPLAPGLARKFAAYEAELDWHVLASGSGRHERFRLLPDFPVRALDGLAFYLLLPFRVAREARRVRPQAIVAESPQIGAAVLLARPSAKVIVEVHGNWRLATLLHGARARGLLAPVSDAVSAWALRRADAVRALSDYTASLAEQVRGRPPEAVFPTYSDLSAFAGPVQPLPETPTALFVGVLERYKNVDGLADAWRLAAPRLPGVTLELVGDGSRTHVVERLLADLPDQTVWHRRLPPAGVADALDRSTALVLPSHSEGLPRVAVEAFARGRPVVGGAAGGIPDAVRHEENGLCLLYNLTLPTIA
jgi:glycosyltransferase involved in cell wall biosynthesis